MEKKIKCKTDNEKKCYKKGLLSAMEKFKKEKEILISQNEEARKQGVIEGRQMEQDITYIEGRQQGVKKGSREEREEVELAFSLDAYETLKELIHLMDINDIGFLRVLATMKGRVTGESMRNAGFRHPSKASIDELKQYLSLGQNAFS